MLIEASSLYPDIYFDIESGGHEKALPYMFFVDEVQFHYPPNSPIEPEYKFFRVVKDRKGRARRLEKIFFPENLYHKHTHKAFMYYLEKTTNAVSLEDFLSFAGFAGVFLHSIHDSCAGLHAQEGVDGVDCFALDRFIAPPPDRPLFLPSMVFGALQNTGIRCGEPALLGESVEEAAFNLHTRHSKIVAESRLKLIPAVLNFYSGDTAGADKLFTEMLSAAAGLSADVLYTVFSIAENRFLREDLQKLRKVYLSDAKPVREPRCLSTPYKFTTMLRDGSLDMERNTVALELSAGGGRIKKFKKGLGTGAHFEYDLAYLLPARVYSRFRCAVGLHARLGKGGDVRVKIKLRGKKMFSGHFKDSFPSAEVEFPVRSGGLLELKVSSDKGIGGAENNMVWGEPMLVKD